MPTAAPVAPAPAAPPAAPPAATPSPVRGPDGKFVAVDAKDAPKDAPKPEAKPDPKPAAAPASADSPADPTPAPPATANSRAFAVIARRESEARKATEALKVREAEIKANAEKERAALEKERSEINAEREQFKALAAIKANKDDPKAIREALKALGITNDAVVRAMITEAEETDPGRQALAATQALEKRLEEEKAAALKAEEDRKAAEAKAKADANAASYTEWRAGLDAFLKANADRYELTHALGRASLIADVIQQHLKATEKQGKPELLSYEVAADRVEALLEERITATKKVSARFTPKIESAPAPDTAPAKPSPAPAATEPKGLNNGLGASTGSEKPRMRTDAERRAAAVRAMEEVERTKKAAQG